MLLVHECVVCSGVAAAGTTMWSACSPRVCRRTPPTSTATPVCMSRAREVSDSALPNLAELSPLSNDVACGSCFFPVISHAHMQSEHFSAQIVFFKYVLRQTRPNARSLNFALLHAPQVDFESSSWTGGT